MGEKDRAAIEEDLKEEGGSIEDDIKERDDYWKQMDEFFEKYLEQWLKDKEPKPLDGKDLEINLDDFLKENIDKSNSEQEMLSQLLGIQDYALGYFDKKVLKEYSDPHLQATHWGGYCGPAACAWLYRGKYDSYNGVYLPIQGDVTSNPYFYDSGTYAEYDYDGVSHGSSLRSHTALYNYTTRSNSADNGLAACWYNETVPFIGNHLWQFPLYHGGIKRGFQTATNGVYSVVLTSKPYDYMWNNNEPLVVEINCDHYIAVFGSGVTLKSNGNVKDVYFMVTDNGYTTGSSYLPYMRKKNFWNLHYGLKK